MPSEPNSIELRVDDFARLFHTLDPFPFHERDLDSKVDDYIVGWARELPTEQPPKIIVYCPNVVNQFHAGKELTESFRRYFAYRAGRFGLEINELFRFGRRSLSVGIPILVTCLLLAHISAGYFFAGPFEKLVEESFLILGWVANWRPLEIFLYDWWPLARRRDLYRRLAAATVEVRPDDAERTSVKVERRSTFAEASSEALNAPGANVAGRWPASPGVLPLLASVMSVRGPQAAVG